MVYKEKQDDKILYQAHIRDIWEVFKRISFAYKTYAEKITIEIEL